jgi:hypothetical protein
MKASLWICGLLGLVISGSAKAQAPAGATGQCKDGTYSTAASKSGACSGHKGVQAWYASTSAGASTQAAPDVQRKAPAVPATTAAPASASPQTSTAAKPARTSTATMAQAPGGGPGMVWVNTKSKVYHCSGDAYYGKTKAGKYVSEDAAKAEGDRADNNKPCAK